MKIKITIILISILCLISCSDLNFFEDSTVSTKDFELEDFDQINIAANLHITLNQSNENKHSIKGYEKQIDQMQFIVANNVLTIEGNYKNFTKNYNTAQVTLNVKNLKNIICKKPCNINSTNIIQIKNLNIELMSSSQIVETNLQLQCDSLIFLAAGSLAGKFTISGKCIKSNFTLNGLNSLHAGNLVCDTLSIINFSRGDHYVHATKKLTATFQSGSNIYYKGNPETTVYYEKINSCLLYTSDAADE